MSLDWDVLIASLEEQERHYAAQLADVRRQLARARAARDRDQAAEQTA